MIRRLLHGVLKQRDAQRRAGLYRSLIRREAQLGGTLFGPVPDGVRREFFCLDEHTWVWHEEWKDENGQQQIRTTRYDVRPSGILKSQNGQYQQVGAGEAKRLYEAAQQYVQRVDTELYGFVA